MKKNKTLIERWREWVDSKKEKPEQRIEYGDSMNRVVMTRPKSIQLQIELVDLMYALDEYPLDSQLKFKFLDKVFPHTTYIGQPATYENLQRDGCEELIIMWCDLILRPLSMRGQEKIERTIMTLLPAITDSRES